MSPDDGTLCWRLLLVADTLTAWVAWRRAGASATRGGLGMAWLAVAAWPGVVAFTFLRCGPVWAVVNAFVSLVFGVLVLVVARRLS